jgi:hypothetical protein
VVGSGKAIHHGHEGLRGLFRDWHEAWGNIEYSYEELIDAGDHVISVVTRHARTPERRRGREAVRASLDVRDEKVVKVVWFLSRADALDAAGVQDPTGAGEADGP